MDDQAAPEPNEDEVRIARLQKAMDEGDDLDIPKEAHDDIKFLLRQVEFWKDQSRQADQRRHSEAVNAPPPIASPNPLGLDEADIESLMSSLKEKPKPADCRVTPPNVARALRLMQVSVPTFDGLDEIYNRVMRFRQVYNPRKSADGTKTISYGVYLGDMEAMQDIVQRILVRGMLYHRELMRWNAFQAGKCASPQEPPVAIDESEHDADEDGPVAKIRQRRNSLWRSLQAKSIRPEVADLALDYVEDTGFLMNLLRQSGEAWRVFMLEMEKVHGQQPY